MPTKIKTSYIIGEQDGTWSDFREYKCVEKITAAKGKEWLEANKGSPPNEQGSVDRCRSI
jgi:hypothetical protein